LAEEVVRRWRGEIDVPLTVNGRSAAYWLGMMLSDAGGLTMCYHDWLSRSRDTAKGVCPITALDNGPRPWRMGRAFEGHPITRQSLLWAQWYACNPQADPGHGGEPFGEWYDEWMSWLDFPAEAKIGVVTHNRNIQAVYSTVGGVFRPELYNCVGPGFCTVHFYRGGRIKPWDGQTLVNGVYLIRHGETIFGT
jgi:broad specificity phosphatase PhoE